MNKLILAVLTLVLTRPGFALIRNLQDLGKPELLVYSCKINSGEKSILADLSVHWTGYVSDPAHGGVSYGELTGRGVISFTDNDRIKIERVGLKLYYPSKNAHMSSESFSATLSEPFGKRGFGGFLYGLTANVGSINCLLEQ